jgi:hypothetical protein
MFAAPAALVAARGLLDPDWVGTGRGRARAVRAAVTAAALAGFGVSAGLALANAPIGPETYSAGVGQLSDRFAGAPTLLIAPDEVMDDQHGEEFYGWELREAGSSCVISAGLAATAERVPDVFHYVLTVEGESETPFVGLVKAGESDGVTLWRRADGSAKATLLLPAAGGSIDCEAAFP